MFGSSRLRLLTIGLIAISALAACGSSTSSAPSPPSGAPSPQVQASAPAAAASKPAASSPAATPSGSAANAAAAGSASAAARPSAAASGASQATGTPIKVGVALPLTGGSAAIGKEDLQGLQLAMSEAGNAIAGHPIQLISEDDGNDPTAAVTKVQRLVDQEKVSAIIGSLNSSVALAVSAYTCQHKVVYLTGGIAKELTGQKGCATTFRASLAAGQQEGPAAYFLYKNQGYRTGILMGSDYAAGHDAVDAVAGAFKALGGTVKQDIFPKLGETDFGPYMAQVQSQKADFAYGYFFGGDTLRFMRAYRQVQIQTPLMITGSAISAGGVAEALGQAVDGTLSPEIYSSTMKSPANESFVKSYKDRFGAEPSTISYNGYVAGRAFLEAATKLNGQVQDSTALAKAMQTVSFTGPAGQFKFDEHNNPDVTILIVRWDFKNNAVTQNILATFNDVSQNWTAPK